MIVITSPGRSGTTFLALLYRELGFDPGGQYRQSVSAGMEDSVFSRMNEQLSAAGRDGAGAAKWNKLVQESGTVQSPKRPPPPTSVTRTRENSC